MNFQVVKAVIFDLDGTLVDTVADIAAAINASLEQIGLPKVSDAVVRELVGRGSQQLLIDILNHLKQQSITVTHWQNEQKLSELYAIFLNQYARVNGLSSAVYPGVMDGLNLLQQKQLPMACLTNKPLQLAQQLLQSKQLSQYFTFVFGGDSFSKKKPDPLPMLETCKALQVLPANTLMVGDSINDLKSARAAGCQIALLPYGYSQGQDVASMGADLLLNSVAKLGDWV